MACGDNTPETSDEGTNPGDDFFEQYQGPLPEWVKAANKQGLTRETDRLHDKIADLRDSGLDDWDPTFTAELVTHIRHSGYYDRLKDKVSEDLPCVSYHAANKSTSDSVF